MGSHPMICIKCGQAFTATRKNVICPKCRNSYLETISAVDAATNVTKAEMMQLKDVYDSWSIAAQMMINGATLAAVAEFMGKTRQAASLFFSGQIRAYVRKETAVPRKNAKQVPPLVYKPLWPENLYCAVWQKKSFPSIPPDWERGMEKALLLIKPREAKVLLGRFRDGLTLVEMGDRCGVTREYIRQIENKALRMLRGENVGKWLLYGYAVCAQEEERTHKENALLFQARVQARRAEEEQRQATRKGLEDLKIESLDLDVRSYNCLSRAGIVTVADLVSLRHKDLMKIRSLGKKSANLIEESVKHFFSGQTLEQFVAGGQLETVEASTYAE